MIKLRRLGLIFSFVILLLWAKNTNAQGWNIVGTGTNAFFSNNGLINCICSDYLGNVYAGGTFYDTLPFRHPYVARWNGSRWYELINSDGTLTFSTPIQSVCADRSGYVYAYQEGDGVYKWDGISWHCTGCFNATTIVTDELFNMVADTSGNIYASGIFTSERGDTILTDTFHIAVWNGVIWSKFGDSFLASYICADYQNNLYAYGGYLPGSCASIEKWNGSAWQQLGTPTNNIDCYGFSSMCADYAGNLYAYVTPGPDSLPTIVKWDGASWYHTGGYFNSTEGYVCADKHNNVFIAGNSPTPLSTDSFWSVYDVIKYDGSSFTPLGTPFHTNPVNVVDYVAWNGFQAICADTGGNVYGDLWLGSYAPNFFPDSIYVVRFGTPFPIDTTILPPPDTTDVPPVDTLTKVAVISSVHEIIRVFPIPTHDLVNINFDRSPGPSSYRIFNGWGICVQSASLPGTDNVISICNLPDGDYFLQVGNEQGNVFKIIRE